MNTLFWWLGQNTITVAVMIPLVVAAGWFFRHRPAVQHLLWVIVLLKFVTPPVVSWPWTVEQLRDSIWVVPLSAEPESTTERPTPVFATPPGFEDEEPAELIVPSVTLAAGEALPKPVEVVPSAVPAPVPDEGPDWVRIALVLTASIWLAGAAACALSQSRRIARHVSLVRRGAVAPAPLTDEIQAVARQLGLRPPRALVARGIASPFVWCLGRLRLIWPESLSSRAEVVRSRGVIAHELAHVRRGDHWVAWVELIAGIVWWWNPLFWFVRRRLRETAEMACDALAIGTCPERRGEYAEMLLELSTGCKPAPAPVLAVGAGSPSSFERRLAMILSDRVSGTRSSWGILAAMVFAVVALPGWSLGQPKPAPADDPVLRDLIEQGKFAEAKARLDALRKKQAADKAVADGVFPEKWRETLVKELPAACIKGLPKDAALSWKTCMSCHGGAKEPGASDYKLNVVPNVFEGKVTLLSELSKAKLEPVRPPQVFPAIIGNKRIYRLTFEANGTTLSASTEDDKLLWKSQFADSLSGRKSDDRWTLDEAKEGKTVTLTWTQASGGSQYSFDADTGKMLGLSKNANPVPPPTAQSPNKEELALAIEMIEATAALDAVNARLERLKENRPADDAELRLAQFELAKATKHKDLVTSRIMEAYTAAKAQRAAALADYQKLRDAAGGFQHTDEFYKAQGRMQALELRVNQLGELLGVKPKTPPEPAASRKDAPNPAAPTLDTPLSFRDLNSTTRKLSASESPVRNSTASSADAKAVSVLDLAERYLNATAELKLARLRLDRFTKGVDVLTPKELDEAKIALEKAEKRERLLAGFIKDALVPAQAEIKIAEDEYAFAVNLGKKGFASPSSIEVAKSRLEGAKTRVRQLESILSATGTAPPEEKRDPKQPR